MTDASRRPSRLLASLLLLVIGFVLGIAYNRIEQAASQTVSVDFYQVLKRALTTKATAIDPTIFERTWDLVKRQYVRQPVDDRQLYYGAVGGIVQALGDRYSSFLDPETAKQFKEEIGETTFEGIGAEIGAQADSLVIIAPLPGSPAERSGVKAGDRILRINDTIASELTVDEAVHMIRGPRGTKVSLTLFRDDEIEPLVVDITREQILVESVRWAMRQTPQGRSVAYVEISHFTEETPRLFQKAMQAFLLKEPQALVVDLRNNPGGFLEAAVTIAGNFVDAGQPVVTESRADGTQTVQRASGTPVLRGLRTYVLVNGGSASAAEILAGALQDYGLATLVGEKTFGKGSVQNLVEFDDDSSLKLTIAKWLTPKGRTIDGEGINPDITEAETNGQDKPDGILDRALRLIDEQ